MAAVTFHYSSFAANSRVPRRAGCPDEMLDYLRRIYRGQLPPGSDSISRMQREEFEKADSDFTSDLYSTVAEEVRFALEREGLSSDASLFNEVKNETITTILMNRPGYSARERVLSDVSSYVQTALRQALRKRKL